MGTGRRRKWCQYYNLSSCCQGESDERHSHIVCRLHLLDTAVLTLMVCSCSAELYGLEDLKRLALRKQGLRSGMAISTILASARYAYNHTPDSDSKLRAQYLTFIIRSRNNFKKSGTMKVEMEHGGTALFFDLFVAMCNHMVSFLAFYVKSINLIDLLQDDLKTMRSPWSSPFTR